MHVERSTSKAFGYDIVSKNAGNRFLTDFLEAAIFEDRWELAGQRRSSQPEADCADSGDSGGPGAGSGGISENFRGFSRILENISSKMKKFQANRRNSKESEPAESPKP